MKSGRSYLPVNALALRTFSVMMVCAAKDEDISRATPFYDKLAYLLAALRNLKQV
jgi:hypothetical protein